MRRGRVEAAQHAVDLGQLIHQLALVLQAACGVDDQRVGAALAGGARLGAFVITKGGRLFSAKARLLAWLKPVIRPMLAARAQGGAVSARRAEMLGADWSPAALTRSLEGSLRRLRTDAVDGFILHSPPADVAADPAIA